MTKTRLITTAILALTAIAFAVPSGAQAQDGVVTVCTPGAGDTYTGTTVPADDPSAGGGPGSVIIDGEADCPTTDPVDTTPPTIATQPCDECPDNSKPDKPSQGTQDQGNGGANPPASVPVNSVSPVATSGAAPAPAAPAGSKNLPMTGFDAPMAGMGALALFLIAVGFRRASRRLAA